jgi:hypothetical protein
MISLSSERPDQANVFRRFKVLAFYVVGTEIARERSYDYVIGQGEELVGYMKVEEFGCLEIDPEL